MHPQLIQSHAPPTSQAITDGIFMLSFTQPKNPSKQDAKFHQPPPESSSILSSPLQRPANCIQAFHQTIQQFNQHLKAEQLDRKPLQVIAL